MPPAPFREIGIASRQVDEGEDGTHGISDFVGHARSQTSDGGQTLSPVESLVGLAQLPVAPPQFGDRLLECLAARLDGIDHRIEGTGHVEDLARAVGRGTRPELALRYGARRSVQTLQWPHQAPPEQRQSESGEDRHVRDHQDDQPGHRDCGGETCHANLSTDR